MKNQIPLSGRTETWVHTEESMLQQRNEAAGREICAQQGMGLYGQLMIGLSMYLYDHVSTPSYCSILLLIPFLALIVLLSYWLLRRAEDEKQQVLSFVGRKTGKVLAILLALIGWLDGQLAFYALCAIVSNILPTVSSFQVALAIGITAAFALGGGGSRGLSRLSRLMGWLIFLCIAYCGMVALPYGETGHLFPLLGYGTGRILQGSIWMSGGSAGICLPLLVADKQGEIQTTDKTCMLRTLLRALGMAAATALLSAYLLPVYALARPETLGYRLLLLARISPSVSAWSLLVCAMMFLMLMTLGNGVQHSGRFFALAAGKKKTPSSLTAGILLSYVPLGALNVQPLENVLLYLAPWRAGVLLAVLLVLSLGYLRIKRKKAAAKEADL